MSIRILIADDDAMVRRTLATALGRVGFDVCTSPDGMAAIRLAEVAPPDIALIDLHMPGGGIDLVQQLKGLHNGAIYVVVMSGDDIEEVFLTCRGAGVDDVYGKPMAPSELRRRLLAAAPQGKSLPVAS